MKQLTFFVSVLALCLPFHLAWGRQVDRSTLNGKVIFGYQAWFACPGGGNEKGWIHWFNAGAPTVEMLPDVSEFPLRSGCKTQLFSENGKQIFLYDSSDKVIINKHFEWMRHYNIDGIAVQRFATAITDVNTKVRINAILDTIESAARRNGRVFFVMYDLSGLEPKDINIVLSDWAEIEAAGVVNSPAYLHHNGKPMLGVWGIGFRGQKLGAGDALALLAGLRSRSSSAGGLTVLGGVPTGWRSQTGDSAVDPGWQNVWPQIDVISPWTVGRFGDDRGADEYEVTHLRQDLAFTKILHVDYMPVIFPGFSWSNLMRSRGNLPKAIRNEIPRRCGKFYWHQVTNAIHEGASMLYGAMFDEVDEGTAMFKTIADSADVPFDAKQGVGEFLSLDVDGCRVPSDWYLQLAGATGTALRQKETPTTDLPISIVKVKRRSKD